MIVLPHVRPDPMPSDKRLSAGIEAESQMAHYLSREFGQDADVWVFHGLRLLIGGSPGGRDDAVQIDHLLLHRHGIVIIESKSVACEVEVSRRPDGTEEWRRKWASDRGWAGMPSPVAQAERQAKGLRSLLQQHKEALRERKVLGLRQGGFATCPIEVRVAVSDGGVIKRKGKDAPEVLKADQVCAAVRARVALHRRHGSIAGLLRESPKQDKDAGLWSMTADEMARLRDFLLASHAPLSNEGPTRPAEAVQARAAPRPAATMPSHSAAMPIPAATADDSAPARDLPRPKDHEVIEVEHLEPLTCRHCRSINVKIVYARDYCLKCSECEKYTPLDRTCTRCGEQASISKRREVYSRVCGCGSQVIFFRN